MTTEPIKLRASSLPGFSLCPSYGETAAPYNPESPAAQQGSAAHACMEYYLENGEIPDFEEVGVRYPLADLEDLRICFFMGRKIWDEEIAPLVGDNYDTEVSMQGVIGQANGRDVMITGTADVLAVTPEEIFVIDWKFGRESGKTNYFQLWGYAGLSVLHLGGFQESGFVTTIEVHVRTKTWRENTSRMDRSNLAAFKEALLASAAKRGEIRNPSPTACKFCSARLECEDYPRMIMDTVIPFTATMEKADREGLDFMKVESLIALYPGFKMLEYACKRFGELFKASLEGAGYVGKENAIEGFHLSERSSKSIDPRKAWPVLKAAGLDDDAINKVIKMSHSQVKNAIMKSEPPLDCTKKDHWSNVEKKLYDAGAVAERISRTVSKSK